MLMSKARQNGIRTLCFSSEIYGEEELLSSSLDSLKGETQTLHFTETQCGSGSYHLKLICFVVHYNDGIQEVIIRENSNFAWVYKS